MINAHCGTCLLMKKLKNVENERETMYDLEYGEKH